MKFVTFEQAGETKVGRLDGDTIVDLGASVSDMRALIARGLEGLDASSSARVPLADVRLLAPLMPPRNVFCVGKNYREHAHEFANSGFDASAGKGADAIPEHPIVFTKPPTSVAGPGDAIDTSLDSMATVDYEAELAVVIGRAGRVAPGDDPWSFVFGYTLVNDVTSRGLQQRHKQWVLGKGIDGYCPMGPALVTKDEFPDIGRAVLTCHVNGELRQQAPVSDLIFDIPTLITTIGRAISFQVGDVIATGTPVGVGIGFKPPKYLQPGDVVRVAMDGIGVLENPVV